MTGSIATVSLMGHQLSDPVKGFPENTQIILRMRKFAHIVVVVLAAMATGRSGGAEPPDFDPDSKAQQPQDFDFPKPEFG